MFFLENAEIIRNDRVADGIYELECSASEIAGNGDPGQFVHMEVKPYSVESVSPLLRRPFSLYGVTREQGTISILYRIRGKGTSILAQVKPGEYLSVLGPLGRGFTLPAEGSATLLVGGGMGIAPLVYLADRLVRLSCDVNVLYGAETASELVALDKLQQEGAKCHIATMDGSRGYKGLVTDLLTCISEGEPTRMSTGKQACTDIVYSCGPLEMMAHVAKFAKERGIPGEVSLESYMACGVGVCLGCALRLRNGDASYAKVCSDGPVFSMAEVEFGAGEGEVRQ
ncbi:MAG: dihydroorotate dehydrogenase electron transfer subunit [Firmicutes bacterium]|nr:dihydroorotate dehydrogenase electron transfer subunit [Bacillota bacterium]